MAPAKNTIQGLGGNHQFFAVIGEDDLIDQRIHHGILQPQSIATALDIGRRRGPEITLFVTRRA